MNLIVIDKCSNSCPYCFASHEMDSLSTKKMTRENIDVILKYINKEKEHQAINIIGGEPFIYNDLNYLIDLLNKSRKVESYTVFTGGVFKKEKLKELIPFNNKLSLLYNVNEKKDYYNSKQYGLVHQNIEKSIFYGIPTSIGFNIYRKDFNYDEIVGYCRRYGISILRIAIAKPTFGIKNRNIIVPAEYAAVSQKIVDFIESLSKVDVQVEMDCMIPKCFFTNEQLGRIVKLQPSIINFIGKCNIAFDVSTDLSIFRCFSVSSENRKKLTDFNSINQAHNYLIEFFDNRDVVPNIFQKCKECEFSNNKSCWGDCLSYQDSFANEDSYEYIVENIYSSLESGIIDNVKELLDKLPLHNSNFNLLRAYYYVQIGDIEKAIYYAKKTINLSNNKNISISASNILDDLAK